MEALQRDLNVLSKEVKSYAKTEIELAKVEFIDQVTYYAASIFSRAVLMAMAMASYILLLVVLGMMLSAYFNEPWIGMAAAFGLSMLLLIIAALFTKRMIEGPFQDFLISKISGRLLS